jgi:hypothetical protein
LPIVCDVLNQPHKFKPPNRRESIILAIGVVLLLAVSLLLGGGGPVSQNTPLREGQVLRAGDYMTACVGAKKSW